MTQKLGLPAAHGVAAAPQRPARDVRAVIVNGLVVVESAPECGSAGGEPSSAAEHAAASLPQSLSALLVELLRSALSEGADRKQRLERGLARAHAFGRTDCVQPLGSLLGLEQAAGEPPSSGPAAAMSERTFEVLNRSFSRHAGPDSQLDAARLAEALRVRNRYLAERMLVALDRDGDGVVGRADFLHGVRRLVFGTTRDKLRLAFRIHDLNADGVLDRGEVERMIGLCLLEEHPTGSLEEAAHLTTLLFGAAADNANGRLSFDGFERLMGRHPALLEAITRSEARWIAPDCDLLARQQSAARLERLRRSLAQRAGTLVLAALWAGASAGLFTAAALRYHAQGSSVWLCLARGCGAALNLNGALILVPVLRRFLTLLRRVPVLRWLPFDDSSAIHRTIGLTLLGLALVHSGAHFANYAHGPLGIEAALLTRAGRTGIALLVIFAVMAWFARRSVRQAGRFELFHFTHLLYVPWLALALLHGPHYWLWLSLPLFGWALELISRFRRAARPAEVCEAEALRSDVTRLVIRRPAGFAQRAGDYLFLQIPALAPYEWHPFTISSAPERQHLTLHVRSLGNFTRALHEFVERQPIQRCGKPLGVNLDGPYGSASGAILASRHAVLIGAGIGVTPFASVLESTVLRSRAGACRPEKVHFYWLNRDVRSFEWFADLLLQLDGLDEHERIDINIYTTEARANITAAALNLARALSHALGHPDLMTGLRAQTHVGTPDWHSELSRIAGLHAPHPLDVFFCGPLGLGRKVRAACAALGLRYREEHF